MRISPVITVNSSVSPYCRYLINEKWFKYLYTAKSFNIRGLFLQDKSNCIKQVKATSQILWLHITKYQKHVHS